MKNLALAGMAMLFAVTALAEEAADPALKWEKAIARFEKMDAESPPPKDAVLFVGSSSIVGWDLEKWFPDVVAINRGFGGSQISDSNYYFDRVVKPYAPRAIVFYAGDNDIAAGESAETVLEDFEIFYRKVRAEWDAVPVIYCGIKPSIARWSSYPEMKQVNEAIAEMAETDAGLIYIDTETQAFNESGTPREDLLLRDGLHLTQAGYAIWSDLVRPHIAEK